MLSKIIDKLHNKQLRKMGLIVGAVILAYVFAFPAVTTVFQTANNTKKRKLPIYCVEREDKKISISFDASWGAEKTDSLLDILDEYDVKTTFFLCGYWIDKYPDMVKKIHDRGHELGNHGDTHAHHAQLNLENNKQELINVHEKIKNLVDVEMNLFRPPFGEYNDTVIEAAKSLGYYTIQWDVDSRDWMNKGEEYQLEQVLNNKNLGDGSIILFHNDADYTPKVLGKTLTELKSMGYEIVPISELIIKENYYMDHTGRQKKITDKEIKGNVRQ